MNYYSFIDDIDFCPLACDLPSLGHLETNSSLKVKYFHVIITITTIPMNTIFSRPTCQPLCTTPEWAHFVLARTFWKKSKKKEVKDEPFTILWHSTFDMVKSRLFIHTAFALRLLCRVASIYIWVECERLQTAKYPIHKMLERICFSNFQSSDSSFSI